VVLGNKGFLGTIQVDQNADQVTFLVLNADILVIIVQLVILHIPLFGSLLVLIGSQFLKVPPRRDFHFFIHHLRVVFTV